MGLTDVLAGLEATPLATAIAESGWIFPTVESVHVIALALVVGSISMMDVRLIGLARRDTPVRRAVAEILPWTWTAFAVAVVTGSLMFTSRASDYWDNPFFRIKLVILALAGLNMAAFHLVTWRSIDAWNEGPPAMGARIAGLASLLLWVGVVICGRWVGFV